MSFSYSAAFTRNLGWLTVWEQDALRFKRVAIAGMGGVGGAHLLALARLGVGRFNIADFDTFDLANFNRQVGATMSSIGRRKLDVMAEMALDVNPDLVLGRFAEGVTEANLDQFLAGVDLYVDGLDFFVLDLRRRVFRRCAELGIPAITAAPIGMGTNWLIFMPGGMSFDRYFRLEGQEQNEQYLRFLLGVAPGGAHRRYLVDPSRVDLARKIGPSTGPSCLLCAGVVGVEAVKLLLKRERILAAPVHHMFDPYLGTFRRTRLRWGMNGPLQRVKLAIARRIYLRQLALGTRMPDDAAPDSPIALVLDRARWAPSGDNSQPWQFDVTGSEEAIARLRVATSNPYEYRDGRPSLLAFGMFLETARVAASGLGRRLEYDVFDDQGTVAVRIRARLDPVIEHDRLDAAVMTRSVHRGALHTTTLTAAEKASLTEALGPGLTVQWFETPRERWQIARLGGQVTDIRLRAPEFFPVHQRVIDWTHRHSASGIPAGAVGLNRPTLGIMSWTMQSWRRMNRVNRLTGTSAAQVQLDILPGLRSGAVFAIRLATPSPAPDTATILRAGAGVQRFWLTATILGLALQPATAMLMVAHHGASGAEFTSDPKLRQKAQAVSHRFIELFGLAADEHIFIGRIGHTPPRRPGARSIRHTLGALSTALRTKTDTLARKTDRLALGLTRWSGRVSRHRSGN